MSDSYTRVTTPAGPVFLRRGSEVISKIDSIVFDCDGVLIDARNSYDRAIQETLDRITGEIFGIRITWKDRVREMIQSLRMTGGFNNDWDTTYALSLFAAVSLPSDLRGVAAAGSVGKRPRAIGPSLSSEVASGVARLVGKFSRLPSRPGHNSVNRFVRDSLSADDRKLCNAVAEYEGYPGTPPTSRLASMFDEMYHGPELYREMYGAEPKYYEGRGYIEDDELLVNEQDVAFLSRRLGGRLALATGRPSGATWHSLGGLMSYFRSDASVFIGDADRGPRYRAKLLAFKKPSGLSLIHARRRLRSKMLLYVGDSAEDVQMVRNARRSWRGMSFAGVYGTADSPDARRKFFMENGAELILPGVAALPGLIRSAQS